MNHLEFKLISYKANEIVKKLCVFFFSILVIDVIVSVFMRYVLVKPMVFGEQLADYCMIWLAFLSASLAMRVGAHMGLDIFDKHMSERANKIMKMISLLLVVGFLLVMIIWGFKHSYAVRDQHSPVVFGVSMTIPYLSVPIGGIAILIQTINLMVYGPEK
jgi:TRAP-type C4-dicarboxylate transport system permease small subunit